MTASAAAYAGNESWMEDNAYAFRNNTLTTLSLPASHDAGMYAHDINRIEIGVENLRADVQLAGVTLFHLPSTSGVIEGQDLLVVFNTLMDVVRAVDRQCVGLEGVWQYCFTFGLEDLVWGWVGQYYDLATGKPGELSITQNVDLYEQLYSGVRKFDLRPKKQGANLYIHHSQANIEIGGERSYTLPLGFTVPCVVVPIVGGCFLGTDQFYGFGTFSAEAGGKVKSLSVTGPRVDEVLGDVRRFMEEGHRELVVLSLSHYWRGYNGSSFGESDYDQLIGMIKTQLGPWLLTQDMLPGDDGMALAARLAGATLHDLVGNQGRVLVVFESDQPYAYVDPEEGIWPSSVVTAGGSYANKDDLEAMRADQLHKWTTATEDRFSLSWTLTCQPGNIDCNVRDLAGKANPYLPEFIASLTIPNANGNTINEIWVDFADETNATQIAIRLNPVAIDIDVDPDRNQRHNKVSMKGSVEVALLSDARMPLDALQVDMQTVRLGPDGARATRHKVKDVNHDGLVDLILRFEVPDSGIQCGDTVAQLTGRTFMDQGIIGRGSIQMTGCKHHKPDK